MRKPVSLIDLTIWDDDTSLPYVEWADLKATLDIYDYFDLLKFAIKNQPCFCKE